MSIVRIGVTYNRDDRREQKERIETKAKRNHKKNRRTEREQREKENRERKKGTQNRKCYQILPKTRSIKKTDAKAKDSKEVLDRRI